MASPSGLRRRQPWFWKVLAAFDAGHVVVLDAAVEESTAPLPLAARSRAISPMAASKRATMAAAP